MEVEKLFKGIAVIVDDQINQEDSSINNIRTLIEEKNIPVLPYEDIPNIETVDALTNIAFIILDWEYISTPLQDAFGEERMMLPTTLHKDKENQLLEFIKEILTKIFVPIFIFTALDPEKIKEMLRENGLWNNEHPNRIFVQQKSNLDSAENLFGAIENWVKEMPSVYVLKEWEKTVSKAKNNMFLEMYSYSPNWVKIIWDMLKDDSIDNQHEFGEFVTRNFVNRLNDYNFGEEYLETDKIISQKELSAVIEGERYIPYSDQPAQAYTGDLFKKNDKYFLNIRAQCDLARPDQSGGYDPVLYCIKGQHLRSQDITTEDIRMTTENELVFGAGKHFSLEQLGEICKSEADLVAFNNNFRKHRNGVFFSRGEILEKKPEVIVACVDGEKAIKFQLDIIPINYSELKDNRKGRILPPYITRIQHKCSQYIVREGVMPIPCDLFNDFEG